MQLFIPTLPRAIQHALKTGYLTNSEDLDELAHNAAFHQGLHCLLRLKQSIQNYLEITTLRPSLYTIDHSDLNVSKLMEHLIGQHFMRGYRWGRGGVQRIRTPLKNHKNIGVLAIVVWIPGKISQLSMTGHHPYASKTRFKWRFAGGPRMARF